MLNSQVVLDTLQEERLVTLFMQNIRGGISTVSTRKWLKDDCENSIFYWDATNLYGVRNKVMNDLI